MGISMLRLRATASSDGATMTTATPPVHSANTAGSGLTWPVLVVDDDPIVLTITRHLLGAVRINGNPLDLVLCSSAAAAREQLRARDFALAIVDISMETPRAGVDLLRDLRADPRHHALEVVVRSGERAASIGERVLSDLRVAEFWSKGSVPPEQLRARVMVLLAARGTSSTVITADVPEPGGQDGARVEGPVAVEMFAGGIVRLRQRVPSDLRRVARVYLSSRGAALLSKLRRLTRTVGAPLGAWSWLVTLRTSGKLSRRRFVG